MPIVVSDTSAIAALDHLRLISVVATLYGDIFIPPAVEHELRNPHGPRRAVDVARLANVKVRAPADAARVTALRAELDLGESEAIALALELSAEWILIDELDGRQVATRLGLNTTGVLGTLLRAKQNGLISAVRPQMDRLIGEIDFHISVELRNRVLEMAGE